jgi:hypothetical protein
MAEADPHIVPIADHRLSIDQGHILRSRFLDSFAMIEVWATERTIEISGVIKAKAQLCQKLTAIEKEARSAASRFCHPNHLIPLIGKIRSASTIRANLVHSIALLATTGDGRNFWLFQNIGEQPDNLRPFQLILDQKTFEQIIREVHDLSMKLEKQKLKPPAPTDPAATSAAASAH